MKEGSKLDSTTAIAALLQADIGYRIELFGLLAVRQLEDLTFALDFYRYDPHSKENEFVSETIFVNAYDAAAACEAERRRLELGFDFERESPPRPLSGGAPGQPADK